MSLNIVIYCVALISYLIAGIAYIQQFFKSSTTIAKSAQLAIMVALLAHIGLLIIETRTYDGNQLSLSFVTTMLAWLATLTIFISNKFTKNLLFLPVVCFVAAFFITINMFFPVSTGITIEMSVSLIIHILLSLVAYGVLSIGMLYACQLAYINYQLKHKKRNMLSGTLPPLMAVERILYQLITYGAVLLAISLISGFIFVPNMMADGYAHKTLLSSISLLVYVACIVLHKTIGLKARITVILNLVGLSILTLGYFGSRLIKELLLS